jgi:hypothetical protein
VFFGTLIIPEARMLADPMREVVVEAVLNDSYDGAIRLLGDAQRFGFELQSFALSERVGGIASATMTVCVPTSVDTHVVATRLSRHPAIQCVDARTTVGMAVLNDQQVAA